jgi:hypothetical protein
MNEIMAASNVSNGQNANTGLPKKGHKTDCHECYLIMPKVIEIINWSCAESGNNS